MSACMWPRPFACLFFHLSISIPLPVPSRARVTHFKHRLEKETPERGPEGLTALGLGLFALVMILSFKRYVSDIPLVARKSQRIG